MSDIKEICVPVSPSREREREEEEGSDKSPLVCSDDRLPHLICKLCNAYGALCPNANTKTSKSMNISLQLPFDVDVVLRKMR